MKKRGFTLAEILVAIGIIGVVSAMVIPQFVGNTYDQANASKLSSIVADYENIFSHMLLKEDRENIFDTAFGTEYDSTSPNTTTIQNALEQYTKISRIGTTWSSMGYIVSYLNSPFVPVAVAESTPPGPSPFHTISGTAASPTYKFIISTPGGAALVFGNVNTLAGHKVSTVYVDVNGTANPNRYGRDIFAFALAEDGHLYPYGSREASLALNISGTPTWTNSNNTYGCSSGSYNGLGCTARLIENNYKMDY